MLQKIPLEKVLFLDIETVPQVYQFDDVDEKTAELFNLKTRFLQKEDKTVSDLYNERAGIYAEFGKIVCITCGFVRETRTGKSIRLKSFYHDDEETLLRQFSALLSEHYSSPYHLLCGHNAKEFDFPYIARRMLVLGIPLPLPLDIAGKKPWEVNHLDTLELWKFGDYLWPCFVIFLISPRQKMISLELTLLEFILKKMIWKESRSIVKKM